MWRRTPKKNADNLQKTHFTDVFLRWNLPSSQNNGIQRTSKKQGIVWSTATAMFENNFRISLLVIMLMVLPNSNRAFNFAQRGMITLNRQVLNPVAKVRGASRLNRVCMSVSLSNQNERPLSKLRLIQHKKEAFWFYRFLSIVYDTIVNPGHWTEDMREAALKPAKLEWPYLDTVDVGGGTGFCTIGIIQAGVKPENIVMIDQSPHQLEKARYWSHRHIIWRLLTDLYLCRAKEELKGVTIYQGDAEELPFDTDSKDRYVSAGSIEYWPEPQRGICEAYRILRPGGLACIIGPVYPTNPISRFFADVWWEISFSYAIRCSDWKAFAGCCFQQKKSIFSGLEMQVFET